MKFRTIALSITAALPASAYIKIGSGSTAPPGALRSLENRADTCPSSNPVSCTAVDPSLPSNFCCSSDTVCQSTDRSSSAICCPKGSDCSTISTINCDVGLQDASNHTGPIFTTRTSDKLPTCGSQCCPFGYICSQNGNSQVCALDKSNAGPATTTKVASTTNTTATSTPTGQASGIDSNHPPPTKVSNNFPVGVFFAGFFPGILVGVLATLAWVVLTKRHAKPADTRGLNTEGYGSRPFISMPLRDPRHSNERSDFLGRTRSRARSMFSTHRRSRTVDSTDFWNAKMPTPPANSNVPINYVNDLQDVPVTPAKRVARYPSDGSLVRAGPEEKSGFSPVTPNSQQHPNAHPMPAVPAAVVPPLRGMNTQRRVSPPYGTLDAQRPRRDSGTAMGSFGSPFQTPEKKPQITREATPSMHATYHDIKVDSPEDRQIPQTLTPARYDPGKLLAPSAAALAASDRLSKAQQSLPSQQRQLQDKSFNRPETQFSDFDFDEGIDQDPPSPPRVQSPPREAYRSQVTGNPYQPRADPSSTFDSLLPGGRPGNTTKDKHATNGTTFTTLLRNVGFPDPGNQMPAVPKLDMKKVKGKENAKRKMKGMI